MGKKKKLRFPITQAIRILRALDIDFTPHLYDYVERGGTRASSQALDVPEHHVIKTLLFEDQDAQPLIILQHGDLQVAPGLLARAIGAKNTRPCDPKTAQKHSGYLVGGTSPFGTRSPLTVFAQESIQALDTLYINGGKRGFLIQITPHDLELAISPTWIDAAQPTLDQENHQP